LSLNQIVVLVINLNAIAAANLIELTKTAKAL